jgi:hypothetical protein
MYNYIVTGVGVIVDSPILKRKWGYRVVSKAILD